MQGDPFILELRTEYEDSVEKEERRIKTLLESLPKPPGLDRIGEMVVFLEEALRNHGGTERIIEVTLLHKHLPVLPVIFSKTTQTQQTYMKEPAFWSELREWFHDMHKLRYNSQFINDARIYDSLLHKTVDDVSVALCDAWKRPHPTIVCQWVQVGKDGRDGAFKITFNLYEK